MEMRVDLLFFTDPADFVDRSAHGKHERAGRIAPVAMLQHGWRDRKLRGTPAAISAGSAVSDDLFFDDRNLFPGIRAKQVVGSPEPCVSAAENGDIHVGRLLQERARGQIFPTSFKPETVF